MDKVKWDKRISPEMCTLFYWDRILKKKIKIKYKDIKEIKDNFMYVEREGEVNIVPIHRLRRIKNKGRIIWERKERR